MAKRNGLGKGLDALFQDNNTEDGAVASLKVSEVEPNKDQPRTAFDEEALRELADSIREHGVIQPLVVRPLDAGGYQIVAGERRWRAARMAGISEVPVVIRDLTDSQTLEIAIIENLQREDLNVVELALGYRTLMEEHGLTQEQVADKLGKSRPVIANTIRILGLPDSVLEQIKRGKISRGHAKALLSLEDSDLIQEVANKVARGEMLVRDIEKMAKERKVGETPVKREVKQKESSWGDNFHKEMAIALSNELGRKVSIAVKENKAILEIEFYNREELEDLAARLTKET